MKICVACSLSLVEKTQPEDVPSFQNGSLKLARLCQLGQWKTDPITPLPPQNKYKQRRILFSDALCLDLPDRISQSDMLKKTYCTTNALTVPTQTFSELYRTRFDDEQRVRERI